jgi:hypothetical protein
MSCKCNTSYETINSPAINNSKKAITRSKNKHTCEALVTQILLRISSSSISVTYSDVYLSFKIQLISMYSILNRKGI